MSEISSPKTAARLRLCREESHETLERIAQLVGVNKSTVLRWERGDTTKINRPTLQRLAQHFGVDAAWLSGEDVPRTRGRRSPADHALSMDELPQLPLFEEHSTHLHQSAPLGAAPWDEFVGTATSCFWLRVGDDSMAPLMNSGDLILVHQQPTVENGQFAVVLVNGTEGAIRRVQYGIDWIELQSIDPQIPPRVFSGDTLGQVRVLGLVLESKRRFV